LLNMINIKRLPTGFGGKYGYCNKHQIDTLNSPNEFRRAYDIIKGKKYYNFLCRPCIRNYFKLYYQEEGKEERKHKKSLRQRNYKKLNRETLNAKARIYEKERKKVDVHFKMMKILRTRIWKALKKNQKSDSTMKLTGCTTEQLKKYIESKFEDGMSWDNYGTWHIDHIIPCAQFDLSDPEQQKICFHYTNLQPMWKEDNMRKGARLNG